MRRVDRLVWRSTGTGADLLWFDLPADAQPGHIQVFVNPGPYDLARLRELRDALLDLLAVFEPPKNPPPDLHT